MKYKYLLFFLLTSFFAIMPIKAMTPTVDYIDNVYSNRIENQTTHSGQLGYIIGDGNYLYCLDPYRIIGQNYVVDNNYFNNISPDTLKYIEMVANYTEKNLQARGSHYYMAGQEIIWEKMYGEDKFYWTTQKDGAGNRIDITSFKNQITSYIDKFFTKPSFDGQVIKDKFYTIVELTDTNNVLSYYEVENSSKNQVWISGNKLYINILSSDLSTIKLVRKYGSGSPIYYHSDTNQDLARLTSYVENVSTIKVQSSNAYNENINIQFLDSSDRTLITDNIDFKIVDSSDLGNTISISNGMYMTNLEEGKYKVVTENVPDGYLLPDTIDIDVLESNFYRQQTFTILLEKPKGQLNVNVDKKGLYQLYKDDDIDLLISTFEDSETFDLELGKYYVIDLINHKKYNFEIKYKDQYTKIIYYDLYIGNEIKESIKNINQIIKTDDIIKDGVDNKVENTNDYTLPNTIDYIEIAKAIIVVLLIVFILIDVKDSKN